MRILYFSHGYTTHDRRFLAKMVEPGHEVLFLRLHVGDPVYEARDLPAGVHPVPWPGVAGPLTPTACLARMPSFARILAETGPDIVHAGPIPTCGFMAALSGFRPLLSMSWGSDILVEARDDALFAWAAEFALCRSDLFVVDCDAVRTRIKVITGAEDHRFVQLPWGLDLARFPKLAPRASDREEIIILSTRSWAPIYGIETVLASFARAHAREPRLRLVLSGDGELAPDVDRLVESLGIGAVVRRPGRVPEERVGDLFAAADVYLSCALSDGTSVSLLEAMAFGLPVVATDAPGNREWVHEGRGGWLAPPSDSASFAEALLQATHLDHQQRLDMANYNRELVDRRADWHRNTKRLLAAYERLASRQES